MPETKILEIAFYLFIDMIYILCNSVQYQLSPSEYNLFYFFVNIVVTRFYFEKMALLLIPSYSCNPGQTGFIQILK